MGLLQTSIIIALISIKEPANRELLEKEIATHSNILAWRIPWIEDPGRLQSMESQRVGHD